MYGFHSTSMGGFTEEEEERFWKDPIAEFNFF